MGDTRNVQYSSIGRNSKPGSLSPLMLANFPQVAGSSLDRLLAVYACYCFREVSVIFPVGRMEDTDNTNGHHIYQCLLGRPAVCHIPPPPVEVLPPFDAFFFLSSIFFFPLDACRLLLCSPACHLPHHLWAGAELRRLWDER